MLQLLLARVPPSQSPAKKSKGKKKRTGNGGHLALYLLVRWTMMEDMGNNVMTLWLAWLSVVASRSPALFTVLHRAISQPLTTF